jgi:glycerol uptake facilitator-like aquaporin
MLIDWPWCVKILLVTNPAPPQATLPVPLPRRLFAEFLGTGLLIVIVVGSGIMATELTSDVGIQLLANSTATALGLPVLILMLGPVSGAHFNPVVSAADWFLGRRAGAGLTGRDVFAYTLAQTAGGICGALIANAMFGIGQHLSSKHRASGGHFLSEIVATATLLILIFALARTHRAALAAPAVGAVIGAMYWASSSTSFANPAVTVARMFSNSFAGIAPSSVPTFIGAQLVGLVVAVVVVLVLYPDIAASADDVVVPHPHAARTVAAREPSA